MFVRGGRLGGGIRAGGQRVVIHRDRRLRIRGTFGGCTRTESGPVSSNNFDLAD